MYVRVQNLYGMEPIQTYLAASVLSQSLTLRSVLCDNLWKFHCLTTENDHSKDCSKKRINYCD